MRSPTAADRRLTRAGAGQPTEPSPACPLPERARRPPARAGRPDGVAPLLAASCGLIALLAAAMPARAEAIGSWEPISPGGSRVRALAIAADGSSAYAATAGAGVFVSTDRGAQWQPANAGLADLDVVDVRTAPSAPQTVFAGTATGLYRSADGGRHWSAGGFAGPVSAFAVAPSAPDTLYATDGTRVFRSSDAGGAWSEIDAGLFAAGSVFSALAVDPANPRRVYLGGTGEDGTGEVFLTVDGGATWRRAALPGASRVFALVPDASRPRTAFAATDDGIFVAHGGAGWARVAGLPAGAYTALAAVPSNPATLYAATDRSRGRLWKSADQGSSWSLVLASGPFTALAVDPRRPRLVYAAATPGGVWRSRDGGASWQPPGLGLDAAAVEELAIDLHTPGVLLVRARLMPLADPGDNLPAGLVWRSADGGATWNDTGLVAVEKLLADPAAAGAAYAVLPPTGLAAGKLPASPATVLLHTADGGASWQQAGTIPFAALDVAVAAAAPRTLVAVGYTLAPGGGPCPSALCSPRVGLSGDGGVTWTLLDGVPLDISNGPPRLVRIAPEDPRVLLVAAGNLVRSDDGGATWTALAAEPLTDLAIDPRQPGRLFAVAAGAALASDDGGASWSPAGGGLPPGGVRGLAVDPVSPAGVLAATSQGVFGSTDAGASWTPLGGSQPFASALTVAVDPLRPETVYAGVEGGGGLFRLARP